MRRLCTTSSVADGQPNFTVESALKCLSVYNNVNKEDEERIIQHEPSCVNGVMNELAQIPTILHDLVIRQSPTAPIFLVRKRN